MIATFSGVLITTAAPALPASMAAVAISAGVTGSPGCCARVVMFPALDHKTPREAIKTKPGLERVKGLIRSYEAAEKQQAAQQGRREIPFDFLWNDLGISK